MTTQLSIAFDRAQLGAARAASRAGSEWQGQALDLLRYYIFTTHGDFTAEDFRESLSYRIQPPPDLRAWGHVILEAKRLGLIESCGYRATVSSNGSPKVLWRKATK